MENSLGRRRVVAAAASVVLLPRPSWGQIASSPFPSDDDPALRGEPVGLDFAAIETQLALAGKALPADFDRSKLAARALFDVAAGEIGKSEGLNEADVRGYFGFRWVPLLGLTVRLGVVYSRSLRPE